MPSQMIHSIDWNPGVQESVLAMVIPTPRQPASPGPQVTATDSIQSK